MNEQSQAFESGSLKCTHCCYNLAGLDFAGDCPECGNRILETCFWCEYDLTNTSPDTNCPECGVPAVSSIGQGVLESVPISLLKSVHKGFRIVTVSILIYIVWVIGAAGVAIGVPGILNSYIALVGIALVSNGLIFAGIFGWLKIASSIPGLPPFISGDAQRQFLRVMLYIFAGVTGVMLLFAFVPSNPDPNGGLGPIDIAFFVVQVISMLIMFALYIGQILYLKWFSRLIKNKKMYKRARHMVWSGPLIAIVGAFIFLLGPLIVLVLYWNMLEYLRRDLKMIIKSKADSLGATGATGASGARA